MDADIPSDTDLFGKSVTDLQSDITIEDNTISGTLKHVTDYTDFSSIAEEQSGNYIALRCKADSADSVYVQVSGSENPPVKLDDDGIVVLRIKDNIQTITFTAVANGIAETITYSLTGLVLSAE